MDDDLPFNGVKVLDLSQGVAAPYCGMMLARNGASVIKVEPPGTGCWSRQLGKHKGDQTAHSVVVHRGKRSLGISEVNPGFQASNASSALRKGHLFAIKSISITTFQPRCG